MNTHTSKALPSRPRTRRAALLVGAGAALTMTAVGFGHAENPATHSLAGSGDAPANTTYSQPAVAGMSMGATATWAPPATTEEVAKAAPRIKGHG